MSTLKKLANQTVIYGVSSILGRIINFLLVPIYVRVFLPAEYGVSVEIYAYFGFLNILYTYGMETTFFRFSKKDISIEYADGLLKIKSVKQNKTEEKDEKNQVIHRGISKRYFSKTFTVSDDTEIKGAELKDGLLKISLERIIPESKKPRTIEIN